MPPMLSGDDVGANHQQIAAEFRHQIELALGPGEISFALIGRHAFEIAEWLKRYDLQSQILGRAPDVFRRAIE